MKSPQQLMNVAILAALVALTALPHATATPFAYNPYMTNECATTQLSHKSPAFGAIAPDLDEAYSIYVEYAYPVITDNNASDTKQTAGDSPKQGLVRRLEDSSRGRDLQKLETFYQTSLEMNVNNLSPSAAYHVMPWPSNYWAIYQDGINHRWDAENPSASEKYATAFGLDPTELMDKISGFTGVLSMKTRQECSSKNDCANLNDGSECAIRAGEQQGYCTPKWFGICHAWAPAALLEPEPRCAVEKNGVTFQPMDIKALLTQVYDDGELDTVFAGVRYRGADSDATTDQYGRYTDGSRRDLGPGYMHVALANIIGRFNSSVVMDVTGGAEVWNMPVYSYEVVRQTELTPSEAANEYYGQNAYPFNGEAQRIMYTETQVTWMVEAYEDGGLVSTGRAAQYANTQTYTYLLELDNEYNVLGGEWVGKSNEDHPDFLWVPERRPDMARITEVGLSYQNVRELLEEATSCT